MRYEIIVPNPFGDGKVMLRLPLDIIGVSRDTGERFISVTGFNSMFDEDGEPYTPAPFVED
jgi:hypothetical protein